jgi:predicted AlkP superfamily phosphohydrolase/phosphomutase
VGFLKRLFGRGSQTDRVFVLGLDGVGLEFAHNLASQGVMPNLGAMLAQGTLSPMLTTLPTVSTVAWATYATGQNPGRHGVYGFVDREPNPFRVHIPDSRDLKVPALWDIIGRAGRRVGVINVPLTYPPKSVDGFMISCFLSPELGKATYPVELAPRLMELDYRIDVDTTLAFDDTTAFLVDLDETMSRRFVTAFKLMQSEPWDFFHLHIMATDRINHFLLPDRDEGSDGLSGEFLDFYRKLDSYVGELSHLLPDDCQLIVVSDHGFTRTKANFYLNHWLEKNGYLLFGRGKKELLNMHQESRAYSLIPGRIYLNLKGREERGSVERGKPYEELREELVHRISGLTHPDTGEPLVRKVHRREELYAGGQLNRAADLIVEAATGYDLKANLDGPGLLGPTDLPGMHTPEGAFVFLKDVKALEHEDSASLVDLAPTILRLLDVAVPASLEGRALL